MKQPVMNIFTDKTGLITGAASGIGKSLTGPNWRNSAVGFKRHQKAQGAKKYGLFMKYGLVKSRDFPYFVTPAKAESSKIKYSWIALPLHCVPGLRRNDEVWTFYEAVMKPQICF